MSMWTTAGASIPATVGCGRFKNGVIEMYTNPFAAWSCSGSSRPSVYGALPFKPPSSAQSIISLTFTLFHPDILTSTVFGPNETPCFEVVNDCPTPGTTLFRTVEGTSFAVIEWRRVAVVEIKNILRRTTAGQWLALSSDRRSVRSIYPP